jgi:7-keto-8-aminopelargonate synthetase-like enzyme
MAPLAEYATVISERDGRLLVDESHAFGVVGTEGRGACEQCGVESITNVGATLGKAFCAQGALVGCAISRVTELRLVPPIRGACAGSPLSAAAAHASLSYVAKHPELRVKVSETAMYLRTSLRRIGVDVLDSPAPIVSFQTGDREAMLELRRRAWKEGIYIYHSNYIGAGAAGTIRCAVFADHSREDIDALISAIASAS